MILDHFDILYQYAAMLQIDFSFVHNVFSMFSAFFAGIFFYHNSAPDGALYSCFPIFHESYRFIYTAELFYTQPPKSEDEYPLSNQKPSMNILGYRTIVPFLFFRV
jgi:hypothetical protein